MWKPYLWSDISRKPSVGIENGRPGISRNLPATICQFHLSEAEPHQEICDPHQDRDKQNHRSNDLSSRLRQIPPWECVANSSCALWSRFFNACEPVYAIACQIPTQIAV